MTSQIRVDEITNRSGLGTVTIYDNGFEFTGVTTFTEDVDITGGLTIGGVLTYEDVTNIDSVGVVTARAGLDVSDTGTPVNIDSTNSGLNKIHFKTGGTTSGYLGNNSTYFFSLSDSSGNQRVRHANSGLYQVLDTSGNVIHQMSGAGKIGIGTAPVADLTVLTEGNGYVDISGSGGNGAEIRFLKKSDRSQTYSIQNNGGSNELVQHVLASTSGQYSWYIGGQSTSNLKLRIDSSGNLLLKTGEIDMQGGNKTVKTSAGFLQLGTSGSHHTAIITAGSERLRIDSSGRLLKSGQASLTSTSLSHPIQIAADSDAQNIACFGRASDDISAIDFYEADKTTNLGEIQYRRDHVNFRHRVGYISFATGGVTERLRITSAGRVGVNIDSPNTVLHIKSTQNSDGLTVTKGSNVSAFLGHNGSGDEGLFTLKEGGTTKIQLYAETNQNSYINSGNFGIGTNSPSYKLDVRPTAEDPTTGSPAAGAFSQIRADDATVGKGPSLSLMNLSGSKETGWRLSALTASGNNGDFTIHGYGGGATYSERLRITADGKVGFKNTSPDENLHLDGAIKQDGSSNNVQYTQMVFTLPSGTTSTMFTLSNTGSDATAMAVLEYVSLYGYSGNSHECGIKYASTRRSSNNSAWNEIDDIAVEQSGNNSGIRPTLFWDNGVLKITTGSYVQITGTLRLTTRQFDVTRNYNAG